MRWPFRKSKPIVVGTQPFTVSDVVRRFLLDTNIPDVQQLSVLLGLDPIDEDMSAEEQAESDDRTRRAAPLMPVISLFASAMAVSFVQYIDILAPVAGRTEQEIASTSSVIQQLCLSTSLGTVTQLEDLGLIHYGYRA